MKYGVAMDKMQPNRQVTFNIPKKADKNNQPLGYKSINQNKPKTLEGATNDG